MTPTTQLMIANLRDMAARGLTHDEAAAEIGSSRAYLVSFAARHRIRFNHRKRPGIENPAEPVASRRDAARSQQIAALYKQGITLAAIGSIHGVTRERIRQILWSDHGLRGCDGGQHVTATLGRAARLNKTEARYQRRYGCSRAQYREILRAGGTRAFTELKRNTDRDGIKLELALWQWWTLWQESGHWNNRGRGRHGYWLFRLRSTEPLSLENYCIAPGGEAMKLMRQSEPSRFNRRAADAALVAV